MNGIKLPEQDEVFRKKANLLDWGKEEFNIIKPLLTQFRACLDIGAHVGLTTLRYAKFFNIVHSFEPIHYKLLVENTKHLCNVVQHNYAVSDKLDIVDMYPGTLNSGVGIIPYKDNKNFIKKRFKQNQSRYKDVKPIKVNTKPIDLLDLTDVDFIKIDVEGYNMPVFMGMKQTLQRSLPVIQLELAFEPNVNTMVDNFLSKLGYRIVDSFERDRFYKVN